MSDQVSIDAKGAKKCPDCGGPVYYLYASIATEEDRGMYRCENCNGIIEPGELD